MRKGEESLVMKIETKENLIVFKFGRLMNREVTKKIQDEIINKINSLNIETVIFDLKDTVIASNAFVRLCLKIKNETLINDFKLINTPKLIEKTLYAVGLGSTLKTCTC